MYPTSAFDFHLPPGRIAQVPGRRRDESRLMVIDRASGTITHREFRELVELVPGGDALVVNTTRVMRARLLGTRDSGSPAEILLLREQADGCWEAMVHPGGKLKPGRRVHIAPGFDVTVKETTERRTRLVRLEVEGPVHEAIERHGHIPLPPYIARADGPDDGERYQTVYARERGSVAAPTAGLHFTPALLGGLDARGVQRVEVLLHVGAGTFKPVEVEDPAEHVMHEEWCEVTPDAAGAIAATRARGGRVWAVGTTSVRTLESLASGNGLVRAGTMLTTAFFRPPYQFQVVDHLVTNFHLPRSTLIMLVAAFAGYDLTMEAYQVAIREGYRFYSYGDAMVVL
ncbi:MAG: tRNA preQ1(34) S-adenosylmethionine ribosyltransferase-isomerase QueA [Cytophagaceae bacterium]|nr:tRNA preQ1(34) S-adenosylmethionine ribosyltransferase-isomerase QueA [Gemmatimonadaceae bacterium]